MQEVKLMQSRDMLDTSTSNRVFWLLSLNLSSFTENMKWLEEDISENHRLLLSLAELWKTITCWAKELRDLSAHCLWIWLPSTVVLCVCVIVCGGVFLLNFVITIAGFVSFFVGTPLLWRTGRMLEIEAKAETSGHIGNRKGACVPARFFTVLSHVGEGI